MNVLPAWRKGFTGTGVVVTILDDGIEKDHPDLRKNYVCIRRRHTTGNKTRSHRYRDSRKMAAGK